MYEPIERFAVYKRAVLYFIVYSVILFVGTAVSFWSIKTPIYFLVGSALGGIVAVLFMSIQYKIQKKLNPNFWILNILIEIVGYYLFTQALFSLFFR